MSSRFRIHAGHRACRHCPSRLGGSRLAYVTDANCDGKRSIVQIMSAGPDIKPLGAGPSLAVAAAAATEGAVGKGQPEAPTQEFPGGGAAKEQTQHSALARNIPVTESQSAPQLTAPQQQEFAKAVGAPAIASKSTMESSTTRSSQGTGPGGQTTPSRPKPRCRCFCRDFSADRPSTKSVRRNWLSRIPGMVCRSSPLWRGNCQWRSRKQPRGSPRPARGRRTSWIVCSSRPSPSSKPNSKQGVPNLLVSGGSGPEIKPLRADAALATGPAGAATATQQAPLRLAQNLATGSGGKPGAQYLASDSQLPVQESQSGTHLGAAETKGLTNTAGAFALPVGLAMEAERPARAGSSGDGGGIKPLQTDFLVASVSSQLPVPRGEPQRTKQQVLGSGNPGLFCRSRGRFVRWRARRT